MFLSCKDPNLIVGNFMADFISNKEVASLPEEIILGVDLHKKIDSFTDSHESVRSCVKIIRKRQGKYAPVVVDILFDYILTQNWTSYSNQNINVFVDNIYKVVQARKDLFPNKLMDLIPRMVADNFLMSCSNEAQLIRTFERIQKRAKFDNHFSRAHLDLFENYEELERHFSDFFPDLINHVNEFCDCN